MAFNKDANIQFEINPDGINELVDERNNTVMMLREVAWNGRAHHLELRKWVVEENGERPLRGVAFMSEEGPHNLVNVMTANGFGDTKIILNNLKDRADFDAALIETVGMQKVVEAKNTEYEVTNEDYYDPRQVDVS